MPQSNESAGAATESRPQRGQENGDSGNDRNSSRNGPNRLPPQGPEAKSEGGFSADRTNPFGKATRPAPEHLQNQGGDGQPARTNTRQDSPFSGQRTSGPGTETNTNQPADASSATTQEASTTEASQQPVTIKPPPQSDTAAMDLLGMSGDGAATSASPRVAGPNSQEAPDSGRPNASNGEPQSDTAPSLFGDLHDGDDGASQEATTSSASNADADTQDQGSDESTGDRQSGPEPASTADGIAVVNEEGRPVRYQGVPDDQVPENADDALFISSDGQHVYKGFTDMAQAHEQLLQHKRQIESENAQFRDQFSDTSAQLEALKEREQHLLDVLDSDAVVDRIAKKHMPEELQGKTANDFTDQDELDDFKYHQRRAREKAQEELEGLKSEPEDKAAQIKERQQQLETKSKEATGFINENLTADFLDVKTKEDQKAFQAVLQSYAPEDGDESPADHLYRTLHHTYVQQGPHAAKLALLGLQRHVDLMRQHQSQQRGQQSAERQQQTQQQQRQRGPQGPGRSQQQRPGIVAAPSGKPRNEVDVDPANMHGTDHFMSARNRR